MIQNQIKVIATIKEREVTFFANHEEEGTWTATIEGAVIDDELSGLDEALGLIAEEIEKLS